MKKILVSVLTAILVSTSLMACTSSKGEKPTDNSSQQQEQGGQSKVATKDITSKILDEVPMKKTMPIEGDEAKEKFHLNLDDVEEFSIENGVINTGLETIVIVKAKDGKVDSVKKSLEKVIEDKKKSAFYPGEPEAIEAAKLEVKGNYVGLFIIPDEENEGVVDKAVKIFESSVK